MKILRLVIVIIGALFLLGCTGCSGLGGVKEKVEGYADTQLAINTKLHCDGNTTGAIRRNWSPEMIAHWDRFCSEWIKHQSSNVSIGPSP